jgi:hypothetical protein
MMTEDDIQSEFGWNDKMIYSLLQNPDSPNGRRKKHTGGYTYGLYKRERMLAIAQSKEGRDAKRRWDETLRGDRPNPGWTTRMGDIGQALGITAVAAGKILELLGYRSDKRVTDSAVAAGCGVRRWDGFATHDDWHLERAVAAIGLAAQARGDTAVADALAVAIATRQVRGRAVGRRLKEEGSPCRFQADKRGHLVHVASRTGCPLSGEGRHLGVQPGTCKTVQEALARLSFSEQTYHSSYLFVVEIGLLAAKSRSASRAYCGSD